MKKYQKSFIIKNNTDCIRKQEKNITKIDKSTKLNKKRNRPSTHDYKKNLCI